jgi:type IV pilus assembly protein PilB
MTIKKSDKQLLDYLSENGLLKEKQVSEVSKMIDGNVNKNIREVLVKGGFVDGETLAQHEATRYGLPYVNLIKIVVPKGYFEEFPYNLAKNHFAIMFEKNDDKIKVALSNIDDYDAREAIDFWATSKNFHVEYSLCSFLSWDILIKNYDAFTKEFGEVVSEAEDEKTESIEDDVSTENIEEVIKSAPVAKIVAMVVKHAIESKASDIHIEPFQNVSRVRYRVDGVLHSVLTLPSTIHEAIISRIKVLSSLKIDETRVPQDGRFRFSSSKIDYDVRVSVMPLAGKEKATLRILDTSGKALTLEDLGFNQEIVEEVETALKQTFGMILVTGPTGSGKSTTLFSLLSKINQEGVNICTLEDPIEYYMPGVNQAQVRPEVKFTFASGLRSLLRQDPDVIMVGEIRDNETAEMAVHAALTGHLLFSTLHTNDSIGTIPRLIDMKVEPFLLASTINLIIAQRLARRVCSKCREKFEFPHDVSEQIKKELTKVDPTKLKKFLPDIDLKSKIFGYKGAGCPQCKETGYTGRIVLSEALPISESLKVIIADNYKMDKVSEQIDKMNMITLLQDGIIKALQGQTTLEEVFRVSKEVEEQE